MVDVILGMQWGDEGKGKIVDMLAPRYDVIARFQGGPNAGHTLEFDGIKHVLHTIPSGIFHPDKINIIGNGVVIDPVVFKKEIDGFARYRLLWQSKGKKSIPVSVVYTVGFVYQSQKNNIFSDPDVTANFSRRLSYYHQVIIGRKFSERFTLQLSPILVHSNYVENALDPNNLFALGLGTRYKITKRFAVLIDYTYPFNSFPFRPLNHPLSIGVDIETGGHVFQLHFSNSPGVTERAYIRDQNGDWFNGDIGFGFNISRLFQITHHKIEGL